MAAVFWPSVSSRCALFAMERGTEVFPGLRLQAPPHSAWLSADIELANFVSSAGRFDLERIIAVLHTLIDCGEHAHDVCVWPTPAMQHDAWLHRRLAICLNGVGELARRLGLVPNKHHSLAALHRLLLKIRGVVDRRSRMHALSNERLPGITTTNPCRHLPAGDMRCAWESRWFRAVEKSAVRHPNILVMSPWSLVPALDANPSYMNLLPLLRHVDACRFHRKLSLEAWSLPDFQRFHQRAVAVMHSKLAGGLVAEQL